MRQFLLQMAGEPGAGKSTLARAIGQSTGAVVLDKDYIKAPLLDGGLENSLAGALAYDVFFALATDVLAQGHSLVLDSPTYAPGVLERGESLARKAKLPYQVIECCCSRADQEARLQSRDRRSSQPVSMEEVAAAMQRQGNVWLELPHLTIDTAKPTFECLKLALTYLVADDAR